MLVHLLRHVGHGGVGDFDDIPVHHPPQLVVRWETGVVEMEELLANVGGNRLGERGVNQVALLVLDRRLAAGAAAGGSHSW